MPRIFPFQRYLLPIIWTAVVVLALLSLTRSLYLTASSTGGRDFHPYWYYGHFVRQGMNPYTAFADQTLLPTPAHYIDGRVVVPDEVMQRHLADIPANTSPVLLIATLFSYIPWNIVKYIWFALNLALVLALPWLALRLLPPSLQLMRALQWLVAVSFYAMKGPRVALSNGQPSITIFFLMFVTLLLRQSHWLWAGLAFGVALSKYSIALPIGVFLLFERRFRVLIVAGLVQVVSLLAMVALRGGSLWETLDVHIGMVTRYSGGSEQGVHLGYLLRDNPLLVSVLVVAGTLMTVWFTLRSYRRGWLAAHVLPINSLLSLWILVGAYHRVYDTMLVLLFLILCLSAMTTWQLSTRQVQWLGISWLATLGFMCLPGEILEAVLPAAQAELAEAWIDGVITATLVGIWGINLWLLTRVPQVKS